MILLYLSGKGVKAFSKSADFVITMHIQCLDLSEVFSRGSFFKMAGNV